MDKYISFDINDPRTTVIAEVMSNKTSRKILSLIAEKEVSGSDISSELKIPLNTVGYNLDKLMKSGLIKKSNNFFWSKKGKKIAYYSISNKKIVISPRKLFGTILPAFLISLCGAVIIRIYYLTHQIEGVAMKLSESSGVTSAPSTVSYSAALPTINNAINGVSYSSNFMSINNAYSWLWFLFGAIVSLLVLLIFNWRRER